MEYKDPKILSDSEILAISLKEPKYFEEIVDRYQRSFIRKAVSILRNEDDAYDVVQEVFVRIYMNAGKFKSHEGASFSSWAYTILINQCYSSYRKKHIREIISLDFVPELIEIIPDQAAIEELETKFTRDYLLVLVSKLPVLLRRVVESYFINGLSQKAIAQEEGVSNNVIRTRIHRAKKELQKMNLEFVYVRNMVDGTNI